MVLPWLLADIGVLLLLLLLCVALQLINTSEMSQMMGCANLHPQDWFKPFKQHLTSNHV